MLARSDVLIPDRPLGRWHGGKYRLREWVRAHLPPHRIYVEPFAGMASVFFAKPPCFGEVLNDRDDEAVNLFRMVRDPSTAAELRRCLDLTPFARSEFRLAYQPTQDPIERARRLVIRCFMGFGSNAHASSESGHRSTGFRANTKRSGTTPARDWANFPAALEAMTARLRGVVIENCDALDSRPCGLLRKHDGPETLFYVDPPYMHATRTGPMSDGRGRYRYELSDADHVRLLALLRAVDGMVVLSGYPTTLYDESLSGWRRVVRRAFADGARLRTEVLWINPAAAHALDAELPLFTTGWGA